MGHSDVGKFINERRWLGTGGVTFVTVITSGMSGGNFIDGHDAFGIITHG